MSHWSYLSHWPYLDLVACNGWKDIGTTAFQGDAGDYMALLALNAAAASHASVNQLWYANGMKPPEQQPLQQGKLAQSI